MYVGNLLPADHDPPDRFAATQIFGIINLKFASRCHLRYCRLQGGLAGPAGDSSPAVCQDVPGQSQRKRDGH